jgi:transcriptional regulator with XRE-family HTH domain
METLPPKNIVTLSRELRNLLGTSQEKFAQLIGVSFRTVSRWEHGAATPDPQVMRWLLRLYYIVQQYSSYDQKDLLRWLTTPHHKFKNFPPVDLIGSEYGTSELQSWLQDITGQEPFDRTAVA